MSLVDIPTLETERVAQLIRVARKYLKYSEKMKQFATELLMFLERRDRP